MESETLFFANKYLFRFVELMKLKPQDRTYKARKTEDETWARGIKPSDVLFVCAWHWNRKMHHELRPQLFLPVKQLVYKACDTACLQVNITWVIKPVAHCTTKSIAHRGKVGCTRCDKSFSYTSRLSQPHITHDIVGRWHKTEVFTNFIQTSGKGLNTWLYPSEPGYTW